MKKLFSIIGLTAFLGIGVYSSKNVSVDLPTDLDANMKNYIVTVKGVLNEQNKKNNERIRQKVLNQMAYALPADAYDVFQVYDTVMNGFAVKADSRYESVLSNLTGVVSVSEEHTYDVADADLNEGGIPVATSENLIAMKMENYSAETMAATDADVLAAVGANSKQGEGISIGIIDTGLYLNQVAGTSQRAAAEDLFSKAKQPISDPAFVDLPAGTATSLTKEKIDASDIRHAYASINNKVIYAYDYVGNDANVDPTVNGSEHGTHVASLAAANGNAYDFNGIAPKAQVAVMKVFSDQDGTGAPDSAVIAALNDAAKLKLDLVNLSLGTDLYDYDDDVSDATYRAIQNCINAGVIVNYAAGNNGKSSFSGIYGNYAAGNPEPGVLGSSANYDEVANVVASSNPNKAFYDSIMLVTADGADRPAAVSFDDQAVNKPNSSIVIDEEHPLTELLGNENSKEFDYQMIPGVGKPSDYAGLDLNGKIAVVNRGDTTFTNKTTAAQQAGASALIVINNAPGTTFNFNFDWGGWSPSIPVVLVFQSVASSFGSSSAKTSGKILLAKNTAQEAPDGNMISSFSSDGPGYNLDIDPTISAPGGNVIGAVSAAIPGEDFSYNGQRYTATTSGVAGYDNMSGTSMAAPNYTGAMALILGEKRAQSEAALADEKKKVSLKAMSTADQLVDTTADANDASVRMQGAGRINVKRTLKADSYITVTSENDTQEAKAELKNKGTLFVDGGNFASAGASYIEFNYTVHNDSSEERVYKPNVSLMIPALEITRTKKEYDAEEESSKKDELVKALDVPLQTVNNDPVTVAEDHQPTGNITVAANSTATGTVKVRIDDLPFSKKFREDGSTAQQDYTGDLKGYFQKYFSEFGGSFVEGYLHLDDVANDADKNLNIPYMGFYGDYTKGEAVEDFDFERSDKRIYNSEINDNYLAGLNAESTAVRPSAYSGSTLSGTGSSLSSRDLARVGDLRASIRPGSAGGSYNNIAHLDEDGNYHLYAGAQGITDHILAVFFVNRSVETASWKITQNGASVKAGNINDLFGAGDSWSAQGGVGLIRSWLTPGSDNASYVMHRGYADINLNNIKEGEYKLEFSFKLRATGTTQTKAYSLTIDNTPPEITGVERDSFTEFGEEYDVVRFISKGGMVLTDNANQTFDMEQKPEKPECTQGEIVITEEAYNKDCIVATISDIAYNQINVMLKPSDPNFMVVFEGSLMAANVKLTNYNFEISQYINRPGNYSYEISFFNSQTNQDLSPREDYQIIVQLAKGLKIDEITVDVDGEPIDNFTYDSSTGFLTFTMKKDSATFTLNQKPVSGGSEVEPGDSSSSSSSSSSGNPDKDDKGCGGSIAVASSLVGALALASGALLLKKKKEEK